MAQYNVTRDIRKLAEEAEKDKNLNSTVATAGLGLGGGFVASQTGGSAKNPTQPTNLTIQANEAQARANQAKALKEFNNLGNLNTSTQVNIPDPKIEKNPFPKPTFTAEPKLDTRPGTGGSFSSQTDPLKGVTKRDPNAPPKTNTTSPKPKVKAPLLPEFKGGSIPKVGGSLARSLVDPRTLALFGSYEAGNLIGLDDLGENIGEVIGDKLMTEDRLGLANFYANITGGTDPRRPSRFVKGLGAIKDAYNTVTDVGGNIIEGTARLLPETSDYIFSSNPQTDNPFASAYGKAFDDEGTYVEPENKGMFLNENQRQRPNPEINTQSVDATVSTQNNVAQETTSIPLEDRSEAELQIMENQKAGKPLLSSPTGSRDPNLPKFQQNFLRMKEEGKEIDNATFQSAQQFALRRGMVFDPETGFEKAQFFGQMFKGQTIGQFLRGEDAPVGYEDVIPQFEPGKTSSKESKPEFVDGIRRITKREIGRDREMIEDEFGNRAEARIPNEILQIGLKSASKRTDKENKRLAQWSNSLQGRGMGGLPAVEEAIKGKEDEGLTEYQTQSLGLQRERLQLSKDQFQQSLDEYEEGKEEGKSKQELDNLYKRVQILGMINNLIPEQDELGFDLEPDVINDYIGVLEEFGVEYDPETNIYKRKGKLGFGKQLTKEELSELSPLLKETKFVKLLEYTSKNNQ